MLLGPHCISMVYIFLTVFFLYLYITDCTIYIYASEINSLYNIVPFLPPEDFMNAVLLFFMR